MLKLRNNEMFGLRRSMDQINYEKLCIEKVF